MGLFDAVKSFKNAITGGAAKVSVEAPAASINKPFEVIVRAIPQGTNVSYKRVYLMIKGEEIVEIPNHDFTIEQDGQKRNHTTSIEKNAVTVSLDLTVAPAGELINGQPSEWRISVSLPPGAIPEFRGKFTRHTYSIFAGLDCTGNDPDSGWVPLRVGS